MIMLEGLMVYIVTIALLFLILSIFCALFQRWNLQTVANDIGDIRAYRYTWQSEELQESAKSNILFYVSNRLSKTTFTKEASDALIGKSQVTMPQPQKNLI